LTYLPLPRSIAFLVAYSAENAVYSAGFAGHGVPGEVVEFQHEPSRLQGSSIYGEGTIHHLLVDVVHRERDVVEPPSLRARLQATQRQEEQRHPLDEDGQRPGDTGPARPAAVAERERRRHERDHQRVVVAAAREVDGNDGVPADDRGSERSTACNEPRGEEHTQRRRDLERPRRNIR